MSDYNVANFCESLASGFDHFSLESSGRVQTASLSLASFSSVSKSSSLVLSLSLWYAKKNTDLCLMTASHAIFPFASVCKATTWHRIPIQISDVLCLGHAYPEPLGIYRILILHFHMFYRSSTDQNPFKVYLLSYSRGLLVRFACFPHLQRIPNMSRNLTGESGWLERKFRKSTFLAIGGVSVADIC